MHISTLGIDLAKQVFQLLRFSSETAPARPLNLNGYCSGPLISNHNAHDWGFFEGQHERSN
jgi:hypothetical protein